MNSTVGKSASFPYTITLHATDAPFPGAFDASAGIVTVAGATFTLDEARSLARELIWWSDECSRSRAQAGWLAERARLLADGWVPVDGYLYKRKDPHTFGFHGCSDGPAKYVRPSLPADWPETIPFVPGVGGKVHLWRGGYAALCGNVWPGVGDHTDVPDDAPRCKTCLRAAAKLAKETM